MGSIGFKCQVYARPRWNANMGWVRANVYEEGTRLVIAEFVDPVFAEAFAEIASRYSGFDRRLEATRALYTPPSTVPTAPTFPTGKTQVSKVGTEPAFTTTPVTSDTPTPPSAPAPAAVTPSPLLPTDGEGGRLDLTPDSSPSKEPDPEIDYAMHAFEEMLRSKRLWYKPNPDETREPAQTTSPTQDIPRDPDSPRGL